MKYTAIAERQLLELKNNPALKKRYNAVKKAINLLSQNPRHPGLHTHEYLTLTEKFGKRIFEAYAENHSPGAYRVFWYYGEDKGQITIIYVVPHT